MAAMIMALVAVLCAFITGWRIFSIVVAAAALVVALFVLSKVRHKGRSRTMSFIAILAALLAFGSSGYFLSSAAEKTSQVPPELHDNPVAEPEEVTLDRLRQSMDSTQNVE